MGCFREQFKKKTSKTAHFCRSHLESADAKFRIKQSKKKDKFIKNKVKVRCEQSKVLVRTDKDYRVHSLTLTCGMVIPFPVEHVAW